jgi:hypothetical protein
MTRFEISRLHLRTPGLNREQAQRLGQGVAERLSTMTIGETQAQKIPSLKVRIDSGANTSVDRLADRIVGEIRRRLS